MDPMLEANKLTKKYLDLSVLNDVTLSIKKGETLAIMGDNGSGKSTLLKLLAGFSKPSQGEVKMKNPNFTIGYVPEKFPNDIRFTPKEYLYRLGRIQGLSKLDLQHRIESLLRQFHLLDQQASVIRTFSKGMKQKIGIMQALLSQPDILILDEPLSGLDLASQEDLESVLYELKSSGLTIILTCHEKKLLRRVADRVIVLGNRQIESEYLPDDHLQPSVRIEAVCQNQNLDFLGQFDGILKTELGESKDTLQLFVNPSASNKLILELINKGLSIKSVNREQAQ